MYKYIYPLIKWKIKPWLKYYIVKKGEGTPSEIITGASTITLENSLRRKFIKFIMGGNSIQDGEPSPTNEVPIQNVTGNVEVKVENANIFDKNLSIANGWYNDNGELINSSITSHFAKNIKVRPSTNYEISGYKIIDLSQIGYANFARIYFFDKNQNFISRTQSITSENSYTFNTPENCEYINFQLYNDTSQPQYIYSVSLDTFQLHEYQIVHFSLLEGMELCKIGDYKDLIFHNVPDNPYYDSTLIEGAWYLHKEIGKVVLNGNENWQYQSNFSSFTIHFTNAIASQPNYSNYFVGITSGIGNINNTILIGASTLYIHYDEMSANLTNFKTWLSTHNTIVYYILAIPTNTQITDQALITQLDKIDNLYSYKGTTYISSSNEPSPIFEVQYYMEGE